MRKPCSEEQLSDSLQHMVCYRFRRKRHTGNTANLVDHTVDHLLADGVVTAGI